MPIPPQNDFLLPFLKLLSDGQTRDRGQLTYQLAKHFSISEAEAQHMSGHQFTLVNRVAWCDVHFCKAGFVEKRQHHSDSTLDEFRITPLGIRELNRRAEALTVGYLRGFYAGKVHRGAGSDETTSEAELLLYEAFEKLGDAFTVLHAVKWIAHTRGTVGEIDFLIAHPDYGVLVMEVKGGLITIENGHWYSTSQTGRASEIKDPCEQAERNRRALGDWLAGDLQTRNMAFALFPVVALPDCTVRTDVRPSCPQDIFIDMTHLEQLESRLLAIYRYWQSRADTRNATMGGKRAVDAMIDLLVPTRNLRPRIVEQFALENRKIEALTRQQFRILSKLRYQKRATIVGGAGTGKTLLAMEKATQLAESGLRVLFLCYNKNLGDWVEQRLSHRSIRVSTYHGLVGHARHWAGVSGSGKRMNWDEFNDKAAEIMLDALNIIRAPGGNASSILFDAVIVDEAQDFRDDWWIPIPDLLKDSEAGVLYFFFDDNQRIFQQVSQVPMDGAPLYLDENLRNTQHIHARLSPYSRDKDIHCIGPEGRPVEIIRTDSASDQRRQLQRVLHRLVNEEGVPVEDIIILTPASEKRSQWKKDDQLGNFILTWDLKTEMPMAARIATIYSYKGLESPVVILTELGSAYPGIRDALIYVGLSRARHHAIVIGELPIPSHQSATPDQPEGTDRLWDVSLG
jgi:hypothetical protein